MFNLIKTSNYQLKSQSRWHKATFVTFWPSYNVDLRSYSSFFRNQCQVTKKLQKPFTLNLFKSQIIDFNLIMNSEYSKIFFSFVLTVSENIIGALKCEIVMVLSNSSFSNFAIAIYFFSIAPCNVIAVNFWYQLRASFLNCSP